LNGGVGVASVISGVNSSVIWVPDVGELGLSLADVALSREDFVIETEVWNEIILLESLWCFEAGDKSVSELGLGTGDVSLGINDINVLWAKVWYEIVFWISLWGLERSRHSVTELGLGGSNMSLSISDIVVLWTEVWYKVVLLEALWLLERGLHFVLKSLLSIGDVRLGISNINALWAEVWNKVVNLPGWLIPAGVGSGFMPWGSTFWWSIIDLGSFAIL